MSRLNMILVRSGKAAMCAEAVIDGNLGDSDHAGVKKRLDMQKKVICTPW